MGPVEEQPVRPPLVKKKSSKKWATAVVQGSWYQLPDPRSGRFYYYNESNGQVSWTQPYGWNEGVSAAVGGQIANKGDYDEEEESEEEYEDFGDYIFQCGCLRIKKKKDKRDQTKFETMILMGRELYIAIGAFCYAMGHMLAACAYCFANCARRSVMGGR